MRKIMTKAYLALFGRSLLILLLCGSPITRICATGPQSSTEQISEEPVACPICFERYSSDNLPIQLDCNPAQSESPKVRHHFCLNCIDESSRRIPTCPVCRALFTVHDPRINTNATQLHHRVEPLNESQAEILKKFIARVGTSSKPTPDTCMRQCIECKSEIAHDKLAVQFASAACCLEHALAYAKKEQQAKTHSVVCIDPIKKNSAGDTSFIYMRRVPTPQELTLIKALRSSPSVEVYQEHILEDCRVPVVKETAPVKPATKPSQQQPKLNTPITPISQEYIATLTPEERALNLSTTYDLPIAQEPFPLEGTTEEDMRLNRHLPSHVSPLEWQVVLRHIGDYRSGSTVLERARRIHPLKSLPGEATSAPEIFQGYRGGMLAGVWLGILAGHELPVTEKLSAKERWARRCLYVPGAFGAYSLLKHANQNLSCTKEQAIGAGIGFLGGLLLYYGLNK